MDLVGSFPPVTLGLWAIADDPAHLPGELADQTQGLQLVFGEQIVAHRDTQAKKKRTNRMTALTTSTVIPRAV